jgi:hypothetical protein
MNTTTSVRLYITFACAVASASADTITLRSGQTVDGVFLGGNARQIDVLTQAGKEQSYPVTEVAGIAFSSPKSRRGSMPPGNNGSTRPAVAIPAGTVLRVRTLELIDVDSSQAGATFQGSMDDPVMIGGAVVIPRGGEVSLQAAKVQQSGRFRGSDLIHLKLNSISVRGVQYPVVTSISETKGGSEGKSTAKKTIGGAGLGAIIGGIAGGGTGAAIGAVAGGAGGTAVAASGQQHLKIPAETRLEFVLQADIRIR